MLMINQAISEGLDIVIDNMNLSNNSIKEIEEIVKKHNCDLNFIPQYKIEYKDFTKVPLEVCIKRDSKRENPIGEKIIRDTYNKYIKSDSRLRMDFFWEKDLFRYRKDYSEFNKTKRKRNGAIK